MLHRLIKKPLGEYTERRHFVMAKEGSRVIKMWMEPCK
jgi:hypothetical protein